MIYQLSWKILPGLRGLSCSEFRAVATATPDHEQGVAAGIAEAQRGALLRRLREAFGPLRASHNAGAVEAAETIALGGAPPRGGRTLGEGRPLFGEAGR